MKKKLIGLFMAVVLVATSVCVSACDAEPTPQDVDQAVQEDILSRGQVAEPVYMVQNFLSRKAINEWSKRMDTPDKLWYVYEYSEAGAVLGYYISRTVPLSYGVGLTNPQQKVYGGSAGNVVIAAPGVDGVFYGGVDNTLYFFFDAETDTLIMTNNNIKVLDQPLDIDAPLFRIKVVQ